MKKLLAYVLFFIAITVVSCGQKTKTKVPQNDTISLTSNVEGDSTLYGLACEGCTDSVLIFLSFDGGDPITYDIIDAVKHRKVMGRMTTGDWIAVVLNPTDSTVADEVINLDQLKGNWVYKAMPVLRGNVQKELAAMGEDEVMDSMIRTIMVPNEQGFSLKRNNVAEPIGMKYTNTADDRIPVTYPEIKNYSEWRIFNGKLLLTQKKKIRQAKSRKLVTVTENDTIDIVYMKRDSLRLKFNDEVRAYYRKN